MKFIFLFLAFTFFTASFSFSQVLLPSVSGGEAHQGTSVMHWEIGGIIGSGSTSLQLLGYPLLLQTKGSTPVVDSQNSKYQLYPNPFTGNLHIETGNTETAVDIVIYDVTGMAVSTVPRVANSITVNLSGLPDGIYLLRCTDTRTHHIVDTQKIIKIH
jgi:hypothetical protein